MRSFTAIYLLLGQLINKIRHMNEKEIDLLLAFAEQIIACYDPDVVDDFIRWRDDPRLSSILQLAAAMSSDMRDQLLFEAEAFYADERPKH